MSDPIRELERRLEAQAAAIHHVEDIFVRGMKANIDTIKDLLGGMQESIAALVKVGADTNERIDKSNEILGVVVTRLDQIESRLDGMQERLDGVEGRLDAVDATTQFHKLNLDERITSLEKRVNERMSRTETRVDDFERRLPAVAAVAPPRPRPRKSRPKK